MSGVTFRRNSRYLTPASTPANFRCWRVFVPDDEAYVAAVSELLSYLTSTDAWLESAGGISVEIASEIYTDGWARLQENACMIGSVFPYITSSPPSNCLDCDGTTYNRVDYPDLYAALDGAFIIDSDTFNVPDLRGVFVLGVSGSHAIDSTGGSETHTLTVGEMPSHSHNDLGHLHTEITALPNVTTIGPGAPQPTAIPGAGVTGISNAVLDNTGGDQAHNNMPPFRALKYCVVAK